MFEVRVLDKYEYRLKLEQIKNFVEAKEYEAAAQIADEINWRKVKSIATLCMIADIYENIKQLEDSRELLIMAYDRSPAGRTIIYRLACMAIRLGELEEAQEYYEDFIEVAPHDNAKYILRYEIAKAKGEPTADLIAILEELKEREYTEEWAFELAYLYHKSNKVEECVDLCDELILWFGEGKYVEKALELKMLYQPLNKLQEDKYRILKNRREGIIEVSPYEELKSGEIVREKVTIPKVTQETMRFNTLNLQEELAKSMKQIMQEEDESEEKSEEKSEEEEQMVEGEIDEEDIMLEEDSQEVLENEEQVETESPEPDESSSEAVGQMSIKEILAGWDKMQENARNVVAEAEQKKLEKERERERQEAEYIMGRLAGVIPTGVQIEDMVREELLSGVEEVSRKETLTETGDIPDEEAFMKAETMPSEELSEEICPEEMLTQEEDDKEKQSLSEADIEQEVIHQQELIQQELKQQIQEEYILQKEVTLEDADREDLFIGELSKEQREIFTYFTLIEGMEKQICQALEGASQRKRNLQTSVMGNLVISGGKGSGKTVLATNFIKAYQQLLEKENRKVGKISGSNMNQKNISEVLAAVEGGYLIIEKAGDMSKKSVAKLSALMEQDTRGLLVILEDENAGIQKVLARDANFTKKFTERIQVPIFTNDELVAFAKAYAKEHNCEIEEMGVLALYNSISNIARLDRETTLTEVREIMDDAIRTANRGGFMNLFSRKRVTDKGFVLIREKDFNK